MKGDRTVKMPIGGGNMRIKILDQFGELIGCITISGVTNTKYCSPSDPWRKEQFVVNP